MTTHSVRNKNEAIVNREFKSTVFTMLYSDRKELLGLYNAVNGTSYSDPSQLEVNTLEHAIYIGMKNDLSFLIDSRLYLYEHQSTFNPNLPLRFLMYIADLYSTLTRDKNLYGTKAVKIPSPKFLIFYNGEKEQPDFQTMKLSQLFSVKEEHPALELEAVMININLGHNQKLMDTCKSLGDYAKYVDRVRKYTKNMELAQAVERAVTECIREGILADFLSKNKAEVIHVSIYEYGWRKERLSRWREERFSRWRKERLSRWPGTAYEAADKGEAGQRKDNNGDCQGAGAVRGENSGVGRETASWRMRIREGEKVREIVKRVCRRTEWNKKIYSTGPGNRASSDRMHSRRNTCRFSK